MYYSAWRFITAIEVCYLSWTSSFKFTTPQSLSLDHGYHNIDHGLRCAEVKACILSRDESGMGRETTLFLLTYWKKGGMFGIVTTEWGALILCSLCDLLFTPWSFIARIKYYPGILLDVLNKMKGKLNHTSVPGWNLNTGRTQSTWDNIWWCEFAFSLNVICILSEIKRPQWSVNFTHSIQLFLTYNIATLET
jgi:hypothetical protein